MNDSNSQLFLTVGADKMHNDHYAALQNLGDCNSVPLENILEFYIL